MLRGIDPVLGPETLAILRAMGHGDEIALVDANFPASANAKRLVRADGHPLDRMLDAILPLLPLDDFETAATTMAVVADTDPGLIALAMIENRLRTHGYSGPIESLERHAFYARSGASYAIIATGEVRLYGNVILRKGVIANALP